MNTMLVGVLLAMLAMMTAAQQAEDPAAATVIRHESTLNEDGSFQYGYETSDGSQVDVTGEQKQIGDAVGTVMRGSYSYVVDGVTYTVNWVADENGFQAQGDHIPQ